MLAAYSRIEQRQPVGMDKGGQRNLELKPVNLPMKTGVGLD
jgi:hypothetical protein